MDCLVSLYESLFCPMGLSRTLLKHPNHLSQSPVRHIERHPEEVHRISSRKISTHNDSTLRKVRPTYITESSSFSELKTSNPDNFHSPLSVANIDETRKF